MGEKIIFQPLTLWDRISVVFYRTGITVFSAILIYMGIYTVLHWPGISWREVSAITKVKNLNVLLYLLYFSVGLSVFTIHLYVKRFRRFIKILYGLALLCLVGLLIITKGVDIASLIIKKPASGLLLLPLAGCISFITMKEAFCFRLIEGYIITLILPIFIIVFATRILPPYTTASFLMVIGLLIAFFTVRKIFMPIAYDIGDKTAYET